MWYHGPKRDGPLVPDIPELSEDDVTTERICACPTIGQCLAGMFAYLGHTFRVYAIDEEPDIVISSHIESDANATGEVWYTRPIVTPRYVGIVEAVAYYEAGMCHVNKKPPYKLIPFEDGYEWVDEMRRI